MSVIMKSKRKKPNVIIYTKKKTYGFHVSEHTLEFVVLHIIGKELVAFNKAIQKDKARRSRGKA